MSRRLIDIVTLAAVVVLVLSLCTSLTGRYVLDIDDINLSLGIEHFDLRMHQPHPPGYLGYVLVLRALHAIVGGAPTRAALVAARGFSILTLLFVWRAALRLGADAVRARLAVLVVACNPIVLYYAVDGQTHAAEGAMAAALVWALADARRPWLVGLLVAAGGSFRPTYLLLAGPAVLWVYRRDWRALAVVAALAVAGTLAWLVPTAYLTGGWAAYRAANDALVGEFVKHVSLLSPTSNARYVELNLRDTLAWALIALAPLAVAWRRVEPRVAWICLLMIGPALAFYAAVLCAEAGYLAGLVAPAVLLAALGARRGWHLGVVAAVELAFFLFAPQQIGRTYMMPDVSGILERDLRTGALFDAIHRGLPPEARVLVVTDFPDVTVLRQMPILRPATEVLFFDDKKWFAAGGSSWISDATRHGWWAAPPIVLRGDGSGRLALTAKAPPAWIVLDPRASARLRALLQAQTRCPVAPESDAETRTAQRWPRACFGDALRFDPFAFYLTK